MSTRSNIGIYDEQQDIVRFIYCHNDGYIRGVGEILFKYYRNKDKVEKLLDLGDLSTLGPICEDAGKEAWDFHSNFDYKKCKTYRSRNEENIDAREVPFSSFSQYEQEYNYIFFNNIWYCNHYDEKPYSAVEDENILPGFYPLFDWLRDAVNENLQEGVINEEWLTVPESDTEWLEQKFKENKFSVESRKEYDRWSGAKDIHYQIISDSDDNDEESLRSAAFWLDDLLDDFEDMTGSPCTYNIGLTYDGKLAAGLDLRPIYYKPGEDIKHQKGLKIKFHNGKPADEESEEIIADLKDKFGDNVEDFIPVDKPKKESLEDEDIEDEDSGHIEFEIDADNLNQDVLDFYGYDGAIETFIHNAYPDKAILGFKWEWLNNDSIYVYDVKFKQLESLHESLVSNTPYMLRSDGELLDCGSIHPYICISNNYDLKKNLEELKKRPEFVEWFYHNTLNESTKELLKEFVSKWYSEDTSNNIDYLIHALKIDLDNLPDVNKSLEELFNECKEETNKEFCKVRTSNIRYKYGGDNGEIYFRVPDKSGINWYDPIWKTVMDNKDFIQYITIVKDPGSMSQPFMVKYLKANNVTMNKYPIDQFLTLKGNPVVEELNEDYISGIGTINTVKECEDKIQELVRKRDNTKDGWWKKQLLKDINKLVKLKTKLKANENGQFVTTSKLYSDLYKLAGLEKIQTRTTAIRGYRPITSGSIEIQNYGDGSYDIYFYKNKSKIADVVDGLKSLGYIVKNHNDSSITVLNYLNTGTEITENMNENYYLCSIYGGYNCQELLADNIEVYAKDEKLAKDEAIKIYKKEYNYSKEDNPFGLEAKINKDDDLEEDIIIKPGSTTIKQVYKEFDSKQEAENFIISEEGYGEMNIRYIPKTNKYRVTWEEIDNSISENESLSEDIEKYDNLIWISDVSNKDLWRLFKKEDASDNSYSGKELATLKAESSPSGDYYGYALYINGKQREHIYNLAKAKKFIKDHIQDYLTNDKFSIYDSLDEDIEKHDTLNPKLFDGEELKPEIKEAVEKIVNEFVEGLHNDGIKFDLKDVVLIGSNVSYNYTKDSDLDIHLIADSSNLECPDDLYPLLYSAYRSIFNKNYDITIKGIPSELYIEMDEPMAKSNGMYSLYNGWIKKPVQTAIPDLDEEAFEKEFKKWEDRYFDLIDRSDIKLSGEKPIETTENELVESITNDFIEEIDTFIEDLYDLRKSSIAKDGEYGLGNLIFKEMRNLGYLDNLKELKRKEKSKELSLEKLEEDNGKMRYYYFGPVFRFEMLIAEWWKGWTEAVSKKQALNNLTAKAKKDFGYLPIAKLSLDINYLKEMPREEKVDEEPEDENVELTRCEKCGRQLTTSGECPVCDLHDESAMDECKK